MTWSLDRATATGQVRVLVPGESVEATAAFQDEDITVFLSLNGGNVLPAAAQALERIASDQLLLLKKVRVDVIEVDGRQVSDGFLALAARYRAAFETTGGSEDDILIAEMAVDSWSRRERIWNEFLRSA